MGKILILGGTGAIGEHLVHILHKSEWNIIVTTRRNIDSYDNIKYLQGNAHDLSFIEKILVDKYDVIIDFMSYTTQEFKNRYLLFLNSCSQYIFFSSARIYDDSEGYITEDSLKLINSCQNTEYLKTDEYALAKGRQENLLKESGKYNFTIIRPYITYSENRLQLGVFEKEDWLYRALKGRTIVFSKDIANKLTTLTYGKDLTFSLLNIIGNKKTYGKYFHITLDSPILWNDVLQIYIDETEKYLNKKIKVIYQEDAFNLYHPYKMWQVIYDRRYNRKFNNSLIKEFSDTTNFHTPENGLRICIKTFLEKPKFSEINWIQEAGFDRITGEFANLKEIPTLKQRVLYLLYRFILKHGH